MSKKVYICKQCKKRWDHPWTEKQLAKYGEIYFSPHRDFLLNMKGLKLHSIKLVDGKFEEVLDPEKVAMWTKFPNLGDLDPDDIQNELTGFYQTYLCRYHRDYRIVGSGMRGVIGSRMENFDCGPILLTELDDYQDQLEHFLNIEIK